MSNVMTTDRRPSETRFRRPVSVLPLGLPRIFQRNRAVEHGLALLTLFAVGNEIAQPFKLPAALRRQIVGGRFDVGGDFFDLSGIEETGERQVSPSSPRTTPGRGLANRHQLIIKAQPMGFEFILIKSASS